MDINDARLEANVAERARKLRADGYRIEPDTIQPGVWWVIKPDGDTTYQVVVGPDTQGCGCLFFPDHGYCKHLWAVILELEAQADEALVAAFEAEERIREEAEHLLYGCDPYAGDNWPLYQGGCD
jgi:hypothetical protein